MQNDKGSQPQRRWSDEVPHLLLDAGRNLLAQGFRNFSDWSRELIQRFGEGYRPFLKQAWREIGGTEKVEQGDPVPEVPGLVEVGGYLFETGVRNFAEWSKELIEQFGESVQPHLKQTWREVGGSMKDYKRATVEKTASMNAGNQPTPLSNTTISAPTGLSAARARLREHLRRSCDLWFLAGLGFAIFLLLTVWPASRTNRFQQSNQFGVAFDTKTGQTCRTSSRPSTSNIPLCADLAKKWY